MLFRLAQYELIDVQARNQRVGRTVSSVSFDAWYQLPFSVREPVHENAVRSVNFKEILDQISDVGPHLLVGEVEKEAANP
jgi:hypothetical protein